MHAQSIPGSRDDGADGGADDDPGGDPGRSDRFDRILLGGGRAGRRFADAAARARAAVAAGSAHERAIRDVAAGVAAPLLIAYVIWVLHRARASGTERLYFLSRDGQVLAALADRLAPRLGIAVERRYLQASRQAWNRAAGTGGLDRWLWNDTDGRATAGEILDRLAVPHAAVATDLAGLGLDRLEAPLDAAGARRLRAYLASPRFAEAAAAATAESRDLLLAYLGQEGVFDATPKAMVDLGWTGSQHETLCDLLAARNVPPCPCYLFGAKASALPWAGQRRGFYFDEGAGPGATPATTHALVARDLFVLMEMLCSADHGTLTGFRRVGSGDGPHDGAHGGTRVEPMLAAGRRAEMTAWGLPLLRRTLAAAADALDLEAFDLAEIDPAGNDAFRAMIDRLLEGFWLAPTPAEAAAWGSFPWDAGQGHENGVVPLAEPFGLHDMPAAWREGTLRKRDIFWVKGALAMTPGPVATALRGVAAARRWHGRLRRAAARPAVPSGA